MAGDDDGFTFVLGAPDRSAGLYRYERDAGRVVELRPPETQLPVHRHPLRGDRARRRDRRLRGRPPRRSRPAGLPAVLYAYGGWNVALARGSLGVFAQLVEAGVVFVLATFAAGARRVRPSTARRARRKQRSYDDLYAVAEDLAARGIADPARIAVLGGSNGGLMVAVAVTQRPDLWCAACSLVPVTDMLRYHLSPYGETGLREYGNPDDPKTRLCCAPTRRTTTSSRVVPTRRPSSSRARTTCAARHGTRASSSRGCRRTVRADRSCCA